MKKLSVEVEFGSAGSKSCCAVIDSVVRKGFSRKFLRKPDLVVVANYVIVATALQSAGCYIVGFSHGEALTMHNATKAYFNSRALMNQIYKSFLDYGFLYLLANV